MPVFSVDSNIPFLPEILKNANNTVHLFDNGKISNKELINTNTQFLIVRSTIKVNENLLKNTKIEFVSTATTGTDHIDISYLSTRNIAFYAPLGANSNSVAEYIIASILYANRDDFKCLKRKLVGIVGFGNIGTKIAHYLKQMNISYLICDPFLENTKFAQKLSFVSIDEIAENCDIITLHTPLTKNCLHLTYNLINQARIAKMKSKTLLLNAARGGICDEVAMLQHKHRLSYIVDCWESEPLIPNRTLIKHATIATPHIAGHSFNAKLNATSMICEKLNKQFQLNLDASICCSVSSNNSILPAMENFNLLLDLLLDARKINFTSNKMKENAKLNEADFIKYFENERKNYPKVYEILKIF